jgi:hypothetical protein
MKKHTIFFIVLLTSIFGFPKRSYVQPSIMVLPTILSKCLLEYEQKQNLNLL